MSFAVFLRGAFDAVVSAAIVGGSAFIAANWVAVDLDPLLKMVIAAAAIALYNRFRPAPAP